MLWRNRTALLGLVAFVFLTLPSVGERGYINVATLRFIRAAPYETSNTQIVSLLVTDRTSAEESLRVFEKILLQHPGENRVRYMLGLTYITLEEFPLAEDMLRSVANNSQKSNAVQSFARYRLIWLLLQNDRRNDAIAMVRESPDIFSIFMRRTEWLIKQQQLDQAKDLLLFLARAKPDSSEVFSRLGDVYRWQGDWLNAYRAYERALEINPAQLDLQLFVHQISYIRLHHDPSIVQASLEAVLPDIISGRGDGPQGEMRLYHTYVLLSQLSEAQGNICQAIMWIDEAVGLSGAPKSAALLIRDRLMEKAELEETTCR